MNKEVTSQVEGRAGTKAQSTEAPRVDQEIGQDACGVKSEGEGCEIRLKEQGIASSCQVCRLW